MITRLDLIRFGRFAGQSFPFEAFTFFYGDNESGKTTVFDALFQELCSPRANRTSGRLLKERYGEAREARLAADGATPRIDEDEFLNLYAIRSGDIHFELDSPAAYMEKIKAELYSGGLDPALLARRFAGQASEKKTYRHNQELADLKARRQELEIRLEQLREKRRAILAEEEDAREQGARLDGLAESILRAEKRSRALEEALGREKKIAERRELESLLTLLERAQRLREELDADPGAGRDETAELDRLLAEQAEREERLRLSRGLAEQLRLTLSESREALARLSARQAAALRVFARAGELLALIEARSGGRRPRTAWKPGLLLAALLTFTAGLAVGFTFTPRPLQLPVALAGLLGALVLLLAARRPAGPAEAAEEGFIRRLKDEYRNVSGGEALKSETLTGISQELQKRGLEADLLVREAAGKADGIGEQEARLERQEAAVRAAETEAEAAGRAVSAWLAARSLSGRDAYLALLHARRTRADQLRELERRLEEETAARRAGGPEQMARDCRRRLFELDEEGVPGRGKTTPEIRRLETAAREARGRLEELQSGQAALRTRQAGVRGRISGSLGDLPEQMVDCENALRQVGAEIAARAEERRAAALTREIFAGLAAQADTNLSSLRRELGALFSELAPDSREVVLQGLETRGIRAGDAGGRSRPLPHLSMGTRDAFCLAARLALARKANPGSGILVLDEPFLALDSRRCERALTLLRRFQSGHGWQIVLLSKDERLYALARKLFPEGQFNAL
jgi:DNA sulfur modification protein DndD